jgi:N-acetylmuramoyl-L-alanine amidase
VLITLVPAGFAGWLVWQSVNGRPDHGAASRVPAASASRQPGGGPPTTGAGSPRPPASAPPPQSPQSPRQGGRDGRDGREDGRPGARAPIGPLSGKVVVIDPGHNPGNRDHVREISRRVDVGTHRKECDTTGTSTGSGYAEADFTLDVARRIRALLERQGATVTFTQDGDRPYGPCVDARARIGNEARADAVVSVHADGSSAGHRGFHVILPAPVHRGDANTTAIVGPSRDLGERVAGYFVRATGSKPADYLGEGTGVVVRSDLGGLNLSTVPKVFIECGNMRDLRDAALLADSTWRRRAAQGIAEGIADFLR